MTVADYGRLAKWMRDEVRGIMRCPTCGQEVIGYKPLSKEIGIAGMTLWRFCQDMPVDIRTVDKIVRYLHKKGIREPRI